MAKVLCGIERQPIRRTRRAEGGDLTRGMAVIQGTAYDQVKAPGGANVAGIGFVEEDTKQGLPGSIVVGGDAVAIASAAIGAGAYVAIAGATGKVAAAAAGQHIVGRAVHAAAADGDEVVVDVMFGSNV